MWWKSDDYTWWWDVPQPPTGWELYHSRSGLPDGSIFVANNKSSGSLYVYTLTDGDPTWTVADGIAATAPDMDFYQLNPSTLLGSNIIRVCVSETSASGVSASVLPTGAHELFWAPSSVANVPETHQGSTLNTTLWNDTGETISESNAFSVWLPDSQCYAGTITVTANPEIPPPTYYSNFTVFVYSGETVVGYYDNSAIGSVDYSSFDPWNDSGVIHFQVPNDSPWGITKVVIEWSNKNLHFILADSSSLVQSYTVRRTQSHSTSVPVFHWGFPCQSTWAFGVHWKRRPRLPYGLGWSAYDLKAKSLTPPHSTNVNLLAAHPINPAQYPLQSWASLATIPDNSPLLQSWVADSSGAYIGDAHVSWAYYETIEGNGSTDSSSGGYLCYYCGITPDQNTTRTGTTWLRSYNYPNRYSNNQNNVSSYGSRYANGWNLQIASTFVLSPAVTTTPVFGYIFGLGTEYISDPANIRNMTEYAEVYIYPPSHIEELPPNSESVYGPNLKIHYTIPANFLRKSNIIYRATYTSLGSAPPPYHYTHAITVTNSWNSEEVTHMVGAPGLQGGTFNGSFSASGLTTDQHWILFSVPTAAGTLVVERATLTPSNYSEHTSITWGNGDGSAGFSITAT